MANPTIDRLTFEMQDARRNLGWLDQQIANLHNLRRENYRNYYRAKAELKTITDKQQAA
jgi:hypothetical protein